ncbi:MAG TPA: hypothetical protein VLN47_10150 [Clostridiaceae bacterium]|nr:hypothetical protein [Clostridiaceae bacterium]
MSKLLNRLNETLEYKANKNALIGRHGEYWFSITHEDEGKPITIRSAVTNTKETAAGLQEFLESRTDSMKIRSVHIEKQEVLVELFNKYGPTKSSSLITAFIEELSSEFSRLDLSSACGFCGVPGQFQSVRSEKVVAEACDTCIAKETEKLESQAKSRSGGSYLTGFIGARLAGLLGVILWVAMVFFSMNNPVFYPGLAAFFMALLARMGYRWFKGKTGKPMYVLVGIATALPIFLAVLVEIAITAAPPRILPLSLAIQAFYNSEVFNTNTAWTMLIVGLAIAAIGSYGAFTTMFREVQDHTEGVEIIN